MLTLRHFVSTSPCLGANTGKGGVAAFQSFLQLLLLMEKGFFSFPLLNGWKYRSLVPASLVFEDVFSLPTLRTGDSELQEKGVAHSCARPAGQ